MSRSVIVHEAAEAEINEAADFYDIESPGLGGAFLDEIEFAIRHIIKFPDAGCFRTNQKESPAQVPLFDTVFRKERRNQGACHRSSPLC